MSWFLVQVGAGLSKTNQYVNQLAEDNAVNQTLAVRILEKRGYTITVAPDGQAAVAAFQTGRFELVLMDIQMPGMDGFEATTAIRAIEKLSEGHIPIVAMTAHALVGDQERCLAAGIMAMSRNQLGRANCSASSERCWSTDPRLNPRLNLSKSQNLNHYESMHEAVAMAAPAKTAISLQRLLLVRSQVSGCGIQFLQHCLNLGIGMEKLPHQASSIIFDHHDDWRLI